MGNRIIVSTRRWGRESEISKNIKHLFFHEMCTDEHGDPKITKIGLGFKKLKSLFGDVLVSIRT